MKTLRWQVLSFFILISAFTSSLNAQNNIKERIESGLKSSFRISLILPLNSKNVESTDHNNFIDFYEGVLLAAQNAKKNGNNIEINVFDSDDYSDIMHLIISGKLDNSDLIIGPVFAKDIEKILPFANEHKIPVVSPLDSKSEYLTNDNPYLFQATTPIEVQQRNLLSDLKRSDHITVIHESGTSDKELSDITFGILEENNLKYNTLSYSLEKDKLPYNQFVSKLSREELNNVIIPSGSEAFVYDVLRNLNLMSSMDNFKIKIYGTSRWRNFDLVDLSYLHSMNLTLSLSYYVDYSDQRVKDFLFQYRALFQNEPSAYAFQAYDITNFFLSYWANYGTNTDNITNIYGNLLQSDIKFVKKGEGFINSATRKIEYLPDYLINCSSFSH